MTILHKIRSRVRKLLALAKSGNENEARNARAAAEALMRDHDIRIDHPLLEPHAEEWMVSLLERIAGYYECEVCTEDGVGHVLLGEAADTETVRMILPAMAEHIEVFVSRRGVWSEKKRDLLRHAAADFLVFLIEESAQEMAEQDGDEGDTEHSAAGEQKRGDVVEDFLSIMTRALPPAPEAESVRFVWVDGEDVKVVTKDDGEDDEGEQEEETNPYDALSDMDVYLMRQSLNVLLDRKSKGLTLRCDAEKGYRYPRRRSPHMADPFRYLDDLASMFGFRRRQGGPRW